MCESNAYIEENGKEILFMESIDIIRPEGGVIHLRDFWGQERVFKGGSRKYWYASTEELIGISVMLADNMHWGISEGFINSFINGWYMMSDSYIERLKDTLDSILSKEAVDEATVMSLSLLRDVLEGGSVVLG